MPEKEPVNKELMVTDSLKQWCITEGPLVGKAICASPLEMEVILDFTGARGSGSNIYYSLIYQLPKWDYTLKKVDEYIEVTPTWGEYYNLTITQKQKLEVSIKQGLTSAAQAVSDYELLLHDMRRYREVLNYFISAEKNKDDHVLRSLFVDRVDAHTGEGYSMITMAKRWSTIITDFIRMKSEWMDRDKIRKEMDVTDAEATVLLTKNKLYKEWRELFLPTIKDRVARLEVLVESRKKSIEEYRNWLKPYMARYRMIREKSELNPKTYMSDAYMTPGFGQSQALTGVRLWFWKPYSPPQKGKPESVLGKSGFVVDPYDDFVKEWKAKIEERYNVKIPDKEVRSILKDAITPAGPGSPSTPSMDPNTLYYVFFDMKIVLSLVRTPPPEGVETDNLMFLPMKIWVMSQNSLLIHMLEIHAREKAFERSINSLIGTRESEEEALEKIEQEFLPKKKEGRFVGFRGSTSSAKKRLKGPLESLFYLFVKRGPYEPVFYERVSKMYARGVGGYHGQVKDFITQKMQVE
ncbi:MAG: hypothetical protein ISS93_01800 [Candidatus Aenigmarchaeota archaeon]|nr:hypothetical protein [Candidatus Aenigmarchaeota archaeon]